MGNSGGIGKWGQRTFNLARRQVLERCLTGQWRCLLSIDHSRFGNGGQRSLHPFSLAPVLPRDPPLSSLVAVNMRATSNGILCVLIRSVFQNGCILPVAPVGYPRARSKFVVPHRVACPIFVFFFYWFLRIGKCGGLGNGDNELSNWQGLEGTRAPFDRSKAMSTLDWPCTIQSQMIEVANRSI